MGTLTNENDKAFQRNMMTAFIQIAALVVLVSFCLTIVGPFTGLVIWGVVMAVAIYPMHLKLAAVLGGREKLAATLLIVLGLAAVLIPGWMATKSAISSLVTFSAGLESGGIVVPPPPERVAGWPIIGERLFGLWSQAATNVTATLSQFEPQLREFGIWLARKTGATALGLLQIAVSVIIAGVVMLYARNGYALSCAIASKISPQRGQHLADLSVATIRSVTNGVIGVAVIQGVLAGIGLFAMDVPHAGILAGVVLVTSIIQVPALLIIAPIIVWVFSYASGVPATVFAIYMMIAALSDNILKPILLGRGVDLPALVVLIGALGGMIAFGIIGLFLGAVILGLGYTIISDWLLVPDQDADPDVVAES